MQRLQAHQMPQELLLKHFFRMIMFLWRNGPPRLKYLLLPLAMAAGLSRDMVMVIINKAAGSALDVALYNWLPYFIAVFFAVVGTTIVYHILATTVTSYVTRAVRLRMISNLTKAPPLFLNRHPHGYIYQILTNDVMAVSEFTITILNLLPAVIFLFIAVPQLFVYSPLAGCFALLVMAGGAFTYFLQQKALTQLNVRARLLDVGYFESVSEMLAGIKEIRLNQRRRADYLKSVDEALSEVRRIQISIKKIYETGEAVTNTLKYALFGGIVFLVPFLARTEAAIIYSLITFVLFSLIPFEQIVSSYLTVINTLVAFMRISELNDNLSPYEFIQEEVPAQVPAFKRIHFKDVTASYNLALKNEDAEAVLQEGGFTLGPVNFTLEANSVVFLVGHNGSGKTTFMQVLAGLIDTKTGTLSVDGYTLQSDDMATYRSRVSAIFTIFHVFPNLYGLKGPALESGDEALERVNLTGITEFKNAMITRVDLSAGQRRRLALATVLLEDREILILDEFVADQDPQQREYFFHTLLPWLKAQGKTIVISTHDLQWVDCADRIYSFEAGQMTDITPQKSRGVAEMETA